MFRTKGTYKTQDSRLKTQEEKGKTDSILPPPSSLLPFFCLVSCVFFCLACFPASGAEKYAGEFLNLGVGARPLGMGGSFVAIADDATATYWNPAGLGGLDRTEIAFMHSSLFGLDSYDFLNYVQPLSGVGTFGLSWIRLGIDDIPMTTLKSSGSMSASNRPYIYGYMQDTENAFVLSYGRRFSGDIQWHRHPARDSHQSEGTDPLPITRYSSLQIGGNAKFLYNSVSGVARNAIGLGGDVGLIWKASFISGEDDAKTGDLSLGIAIQDFLKTRIIWNTTTSPSHTDIIPPNLKIGAAYSRQIPSIASQVLLSMDADTRYGLEMHYGIEYVLGDVLSLRVGVQEQNLTAGAGLHIAFVRGGSSVETRHAVSLLVDYAFLSHELGNTHRISLMTKF